MDENTQTWSLSVVLVPFTGHASLLRFLEKFSSQNDLSQVEVVIPCDERISDTEQLQERYPNVVFMPNRGVLTYAELRAIGVRRTHGQIVAITEAQCIPASDWCERVKTAHQATYPVIGGVVEKQQGSALSWAMYLYDYGRYMPPVEDGPAEYLTDCNVSYKRNALDDVATTWSEEFHETSVHWALQARGELLWISSDIVVYHARDVRLREALEDRYEFGRLFASTRVAATTPAKRCFLAATTWLLPMLMIGRVAKTVFTKRAHVGQFVRALPLLLLIAIVWAFGEWMGYVTGRAGRSLSPSCSAQDPHQPNAAASA